MIMFIIPGLVLILLYLIIVSIFFKRCPYCKCKYCSKTPDYYTCNKYYRNNKDYGNVCYNCYHYNKNVKH